MVQAEKAYKISRAAFDITVGPLTQLWRKARREKFFPADSAVMNTKRRVGFDKVIIDKNSGTIRLLKPGMRLDLGGIAQGYIGQRVLDQLTRFSISSALVNVSGDILVSNPPAGKKGWTIGINLPEKDEELQDKNLELSNCAVSTSGDVYQFIEHNGKRYSHIIDPRTGYGVTSQKNVTVIAKDGTTADWLSTACSILSVRKAKRLAKKMKAGLIIAQMKSNRIEYYTSKNIKSYYLLQQ
jgi:thiamine biosynthesis lipoprotein